MCSRVTLHRVFDNESERRGGGTLVVPPLTVVLVVVPMVLLLLLAHGLPLQEAEGHEKHAQTPTAKSARPNMAASHPRACDK